MSALYNGPVVWAIWGVLGAIAVVGGTVFYRAFRAYRAHRTTPMFYLGAGLLLISVGMPALWLGAFWLTGDIIWCSLAALSGVLVGFVLILISVQSRAA